jgi:serine/threonine protein kinase
MKEIVGSGGFGHVCSAFDLHRVLQHKYVGNGTKRAFKVSFKHLRVEDGARYMWVMVDGARVAFEVKLPDGEIWPLQVELAEAPRAGASVAIGTYEQIAIKRVTDVFSDLQHSKYTLREVKLLLFFNHENIIGLRDVFLPPTLPPGHRWNDLYLVNDLMDNNLRQIVKSKQPITMTHASYFMWQIFCGVKAMHDANIIHRDLKPHNVLINQNCDIKVCDFGMARMEQVGDDMTEEVQTIWYRSPEVLVESRTYSKPIDMWACGCILGELLARKALYMGRHTRNMLELIVKMLGTPTDGDLCFDSDLGNVRQFLKSIPQAPINWEQWKQANCPQADSRAIHLISNLLVFHPGKRFTVEEALNHPFCYLWRELTEEGDDPDMQRQMQMETNGANEQRPALNAIIERIEQIAETTTPSLQDDVTTLLQQLTDITSEIIPILEARYGWNKTSRTFTRPLTPADISGIAYLCKSLRNRPLPGETKQFDDAFEAQFRDIPVQKEQEAMQIARIATEKEIERFRNQHREALRQPVNRGFRLGNLPSSMAEANDVQCIELTAFPATPVGPPPGSADWGAE